MDIYDNITAILKEKKMSRRQLAIEAGIPESTLAAAFARKSEKFSADNLKKIAKVLGVSPSDLDPRINSLLNMYKVQEDILNDIDKQIDHNAYVYMIREEFVAEGFLNAIKNDATRENMYTILAQMFCLNAEGQRKLIDYAQDLNKITEYRNEGAMFAVKVLTSSRKEE